jgi:tetratricopeptide (TPR) repeat protein
MGRKNYAGLTPFGVALMNSHNQIAELIKDNYTRTTDVQPPSNPWDEWVEVWNNERQNMHWERRLPNGQVVESSATPPPVDYQLVLNSRQISEMQIVRRISPNSSAAILERQRRIEEAKIQLVLKERQALVEERCATKLQALYRQQKARNTTQQLRAQTIAATRIKRRIRSRIQQKKHHASIKIQALYRMTTARSYYREFLFERLYSHRSSRLLACTVQRLWRGFKGRSRFRRKLEISTLPNPSDAYNYDIWVQCQIDAGAPKRELGVFAEYVLSGYPRTWRERNLVKRNGKFFRDVSFYANTITRRASWEKPKGWVFNDIEEYYALRVQTFWRARVVKRKIKLLVKAKKLLTNTFDSRSTSDIVSLCNYTFYVHVKLHDYEKARSLYSKMMSYMEMRVDNAFVLYSYAIFAAVSGEEDWDEIKDYVRRASRADDIRRRRGGGTGEYDIASCAFHLEAVSNDGDSSGDSWHNLALCQMLVHQDLSGARRSFLRALQQSPNNKTLSLNYNVLLQDDAYLNLSHAVQEEYRRSLQHKKDAYF